MAVFTGATFTTLDVNLAGAVTFSNVGDAVTTVQNTTSGGTVTALTRLVDGAANALTVVADDSTTGNEGVTTFAAITANNEETMTLTSGSNAGEDLTITTLTNADLTTLNITGTADVIITNAIVSNTALATVDASGAAAAVTVNGSASTVATTFTAASTGTGVQTFTGGAGADTINGGAGADVLVGGAGNDTISGGAGADTNITGGFGADSLTGGAGDDNFIQTDLHGVIATSLIDASTGNAMAAGVTLAAGDTVTFGNGVDVYTDFTAGGTVDDIDTFVAGAATSVLGIAHDQLNAGDDINFLSGAFNASTNAFVISADGIGADTLIVSIDESVAESLDTTANCFILQGVDSDDLVAGDFI
jgi:hypothetical protein